MFSSVMNFFSKKPAAQDEKPPASQQKEDGIDEFLKNTTTEQEAIAKLDIKPEVSAYFLSLEELGSRLIKLETDEEAKDLLQLGVNKRQDLFWEKLKNWKYSELKDEFRPDYAANKFGGIDFNNQEATSILRSIALDVLKQIGKKLISGEFNLTTISIHIRIMQPFSILQTVARSLFQFPIYLSIANKLNDPLERFKLVVVACISGYFRASSFIKPLNPVLGETYEMEFEDGSQVYLEQTSHHPPVSHFYLLGPNKSFKYYGFGNYKTGGGLNSMKVYNSGKRWVEFSDGQKIFFNYCNEAYNNAFMGVMRHESFGDMVFKDEKNGFELNLKIGQNPKKQTDFFVGEITLNKITLSKVHGSYVQFIEFDDIRYWDIRENVEIKAIENQKQLPSSSVYRNDRVLLSQRKVEAAQVAKEAIENLQRKDRKLRQAQSGSHH